MRKIDINQLDFEKGNGLIPAIVQDVDTHKVLMLGYMDEAAVEKTLSTEKVTFYSRSKNRLWTKGETSGNFLYLVEIAMDCDQDAILVKVRPKGPTCHTGDDTCFQEVNQKADFLSHLERVIQSRKAAPSVDSYTARLFQKGINKIAQKVGEEAVEIVIEAKDDNRDLFLNEAADLMFHYLVLLAAKGESLADVIEVLEGRHQ
ncbi:MAG: bifunctional phosphoribosyl-AMP cyclohydrolase/phosphoribosyl-ATP diphosphatase HisIE [Bacteroidota bacterium]